MHSLHSVDGAIGLAFMLAGFVFLAKGILDWWDRRYLIKSLSKDFGRQLRLPPAMGFRRWKFNHKAVLFDLRE
jgi:hypothetical protein